MFHFLVGGWGFSLLTLYSSDRGCCRSIKEVVASPRATAGCWSDWLLSAGVGLYIAMAVKTFSLMSLHRQRMLDFSMHYGIFPCRGSSFQALCSLFSLSWLSFSLAQVSYFLSAPVPQLPQNPSFLSFSVFSMLNKPHPPHQWVLTMSKMTGAMRGNTQQKTICLKMFKNLCQDSYLFNHSITV